MKFERAPLVGPARDSSWELMEGTPAIMALAVRRFNSCSIVLMWTDVATVCCLRSTGSYVLIMLDLRMELAVPRSL